jgi:transmembrane sensor
MLNDKLAVLMTRHLTKEASSQEEKELLDLLATAPEQHYFLDLLSAYWHQHNADRGGPYETADEHFRYIIASAHELTLYPDPLQPPLAAFPYSKK